MLKESIDQPLKILADGQRQNLKAINYGKQIFLRDEHTSALNHKLMEYTYIQTRNKSWTNYHND